MSRRFTLLLAVAALLVAPLASANDLLQLYQQALTQDQTLAAAEHARDAAVEAKPQAWAAVLPQISGSSGIQRQEINSSGQSVIGTSVIHSNFSTRWTWSVNFDDTLFSFADFRSIAQSDVQVAAAENTFLGAQQDLILRVAQAYFGVLSAKDTVRADVAARNAFKAELDEARARFKVGLSTITDVQQAQASYDSSRATLIGDRRALANAHQALGVIVGHDVAQLQPLMTDIPLVGPSPATPQAWVAKAADDNFDVRNAQLQWDIAQREVGIQRAERYPTLDLQGAVGRSAITHLPTTNQGSYVIGLSLDLPLFEGGLIRARVRQATATAAQNQSQYQLARRTNAQQVRDAYRGVISGIASVKAFKQAVASSRTALQSTQMGFRVGTQTETDVLTALQNLDTALKSYYQSRYDYLDAVLSLKQLSGQLTVADLQRVDALLNRDTDNAPPQFPSVLPAAHRPPARPSA